MRMLVLIGLCIFGTTAVAATFTVNTTDDTNDTNPGDGVCIDANGNCSLRAAIQEANALAGADDIILPGGTYTLTIAGANENAAATGDLDINGDLTITGAATQSTIINADSLDRVFHILGGTVSLELLWIQEGYAVAAHGGGIRNQATLSLTDVQISNCGAEGDNGNMAGGGFGGGLWNSGTATLLRTTINNCVAQGGNGSDGANCGGGGGSGGGGGFGGALFNGGTGTLTITSSTFSGNAAIGGQGGRGRPHNGCGLNNGFGGNGGGDGGQGGPGFGGGGPQNGQNGNFGGGGGGGGSNWTNPGSGGDGGYGGGGGGPGARLAGNAGGTTGSGGFGAGNGASGCCSAAGGSGGGAGLGGGIFNNGGNITLLHTTIVMNGTIGGAGGNGGFTGPGTAGSAIGGGIFNRSGSVDISGSIVALNMAPGSDPDLYGTINSASGYNWFQIVGSASLAGTTSNNTYGQDPLLEPLANTGGNTWTHDPAFCSPVVDAGNLAVAPAIDQLENPPILNPDLGAQEDLPEFVLMLGNDTLLCAGQSVTFDVSAFGTSYFWSTGATTAIETLVGPGSYSVTVVDGNCTKADTIDITGGYAFTASATTSTCQLPNGTATATPLGGSAPHTYQWDAAAGAQTTATATGLLPGTYSVTITDNGGCDVDTQLTVNSLPPLAATTDSVFIDCFGASTGAGTVIVSGGNSPYQYLWAASAGSQTAATATGLVAGTHNVTITDSDNCTLDTFVVVNQAAQLVLDTSATNALCFGASDGTTTVTAVGGTTPYTYAWSASAGSQTTATATGIGAGTHSVTVTDANNCTADTFAIVTAPTALTVSTDSTVVTCNGGTDGTATVTPAGGTPSYTYLWNAAASSQMTATATGLTAATYGVTVTDANGCTVNATVTVTEPTVVSITSETAVNTSACGIIDGTITVVASGGTGALEYSIDGGSSYPSLTGQFANLAPGSYDVAVRDALGCVITGSTLVISDPAFPVANLSSALVACNGGSDGTATAAPGVGPAPFTYLWDAAAGNQTTETATGLPAGTYSVTFTDAGNCVSDTTVTVSEPLPLTATTAPSPTSCFQGNDGSASVTPAGGTGPYTYLWDANASNQTSATATGLSAGGYNVTITDDSGCVAIQSQFVSEPVLLTTTTAQTPASCNGLGDGSATVTPAGGVTPYFIQWGAGTGNQVGTTATTIAGGTYFVSITDGFGCVLDTFVTVVQPDPLVASPDSTPVTCNGENDGLAWVFVTGGTTPYTYQWGAAAGGVTTAWAGSLTAGNYDVTVTDASGCTDDATVIVTEPAAIVVNNLTGTNITSCQGSDGTVTVDVTGGIGPYSISTNNGSNFPHDSVVATGLSAGLQLIVVMDSNGCTVPGGGITLFDPPGPVVYLGPDTAICEGFTLNLNVGQVGTYQWSTGESTVAIGASTTGTYTVTFTDPDNCIGIDSIHIDVLHQSVADWLSPTWVCNSDPQFYVEVSEPGGIFDGNGIIENRTGLFRPSAVNPGVHPITYTIDGQCGDSTTAWVVVAPSPYVWLGPDRTFDLDLGQRLDAGPGHDSYLWNDSLVSRTFEPHTDGKYWVTVENEHGCTWTDTINLRVDCVPELWIPSAFTPDGDGLNDELVITGHHVGDYQIHLFSRQGELIWQSNDINATWNGKHGGSLVPDGVYVYRVTYEGCPGHRQKAKFSHHMGHVTVLH